VAIPARVAGWLEFGVAVMIIALGVAALVRGLGSQSKLHLHRHSHSGPGVAHTHVHFHDGGRDDHGRFRHTLRATGLKPLVVGAVHGVAGSAALTLMVLTQIPSAALGALYLLVFGIGSIVSMLAISALIGAPLALVSGRFGGLERGVQVVAGLLAVVFGVWYA
jgi:ABC-type nickel/cobalt efflux system permease component RcnA